MFSIDLINIFKNAVNGPVEREKNFQKMKFI